MDLAREHLLAGAGLAGEQHRRRVTRDELGARQRRAHRRAARDDLAVVLEPIEIRAQLAVLDVRAT